MKKTSFVLVAIFLLACVPFVVGCKNGQSARTHYQINATLNEYTLTATQTVNYYNDTDTVINFLKFNLYANAYRKDAKYSPVSAQNYSQSYPNGQSFGNIEIKNVVVQGQNVDFSIEGEDKNVLLVPLIAEIFPDERAKIVIEYTVNLANVISRTGYNAKTINLANFYPILCVKDKDGFYECVYYSAGDPFYSDCADYEVSFSCNSEYVVSSSGQKICQNVNGDIATYKFKLDNARSFAFVLSKEFQVINKKSNDVEIYYYYYDDKTPEQSLDYAVKSFEFFYSQFGCYPYSTYSVTQTKFVQGGMEYPALVMISDCLEEGAYGEVIVHETAHQWWQTAVGNNEIEYGFLDEGLAEYSVILFYERFSEYGLSRENMIKSAEQTYKVFCTVSDKLFGKVDTKMLRSLKDFNSEYEYVNMAYIKPCIMYDNLRKTIGEKRFFSGLKKYYFEYIYKNATPDDLVGCFEKIGAGTNGFFDSFFNGKVII